MFNAPKILRASDPLAGLSSTVITVTEGSPNGFDVESITPYGSRSPTSIGGFPVLWAYFQDPTIFGRPAFYLGFDGNVPNSVFRAVQPSGGPVCWRTFWGLGPPVLQEVYFEGPYLQFAWGVNEVAPNWDGSGIETLTFYHE